MIRFGLAALRSMNWGGKPLSSYKTIIKLIGSTKTKEG
jgi:hypothetical protein